MFVNIAVAVCHGLNQLRGFSEMLADLFPVAVKFLLQLIELFLQLACTATAVSRYQIGKTSAARNTQGKGN
jgi:hypothetical protein